MMRIAHGTLLLALVGTGAFAADIYRTTAPDGTVSYSDRPQGAQSEFVYAATPRVARTAPGTAPTAVHRLMLKLEWQGLLIIS